MDNKQFDAMFSGVIGQEYETLKLICPLAAKMSRFVGESIAEFAKTHSDKTLSVSLGSKLSEFCKSARVRSCPKNLGI